MALDPRIPLMAQTARIAGPMEHAQNALNMKGLLQQQQLQQVQMQQAQRQQEEEAALREALAASGGDWQGVSKTLLSRGMVAPALKIEEMMAGRQKSQAEAEKAQREMVRLRIQDGAKLLVGATDPQKYAAARATAIRRGHAQPDEWPEQYDPNFVANEIAQARTVEDMLAQGKPLSDVGKMLEDAKRGTVPPEIAAQAVHKMTTHAPAASTQVVTYGSPVPVRLGDNSVGYVQPGNREGAAPQMMIDPTTKEPLRKPQEPQEIEYADKKAARIESQKQQASSVLQTVREAKEMVGYTTAGVGGLSRTLPQVPARDLSAKLDTVKANLGFDRLQQMRDASPTGGALGQVAVQELNSLQSTVASLDQLQSPDQVKKALEKIEGHYSRWLKTLESAGQKQTGAKPSAKAKPPALGERRNGYIYKGGDPNKQDSWEKAR